MSLVDELREFCESGAIATPSEATEWDPGCWTYERVIEASRARFTKEDNRHNVNYAEVRERAHEAERDEQRRVIEERERPKQLGIF